MPKKKPPKGRTERIVFPHMRKASLASRKAWEARWTKAAVKGELVGPKGIEFLKRLGPGLVPSRIERDEEEEEVQMLGPRKASRFIYVEEPIGRVGGSYRKKK